MADIFISYASPDRPLAIKLARDLSQKNYSVWWDFELVGGADFRTTIMEQLSVARIAIVIWTTHSVRSRWVNDEADEALRTGKLIPMRVEHLPAGSIPLGFRSLHTLVLDDLDALFRSLSSRGFVPGAAARLPEEGPNDLWRRFAAKDLVALHYVVNRIMEFQKVDDKVGAVDFLASGIPHLDDEVIMQLYNGLPPELQRRWIPHLPQRVADQASRLLMNDLRTIIADDFNFWYGLKFNDIKQRLKEGHAPTISLLLKRFDDFEQFKLVPGMLDEDERDNIVENLHGILACLPKRSIDAFLARTPTGVRQLFFNQIFSTLRDDEFSLSKELRGFLVRVEGGSEESTQTLINILMTDYEKREKNEANAELSQSTRMTLNALSDGAFVRVLSRLPEAARNEIYDILIWAAVSKMNGFRRPKSSSTSR